MAESKVGFHNKISEVQFKCDSINGVSEAAPCQRKKCFYIMEPLRKAEEIYCAP